MNESSENSEKTQRRSEERLERWVYRQNAGVKRATGGNVKSDSIDKPAEATTGERTPAETMAKEQNTGAMRAAGVSAKQQGDGIGGSLVYIKFLHIAQIFFSL